MSGVIFTSVKMKRATEWYVTTAFAVAPCGLHGPHLNRRLLGRATLNPCPATAFEAARAAVCAAWTAAALARERRR